VIWDGNDDKREIKVKRARSAIKYFSRRRGDTHNDKVSPIIPFDLP